MSELDGQTIYLGDGNEDDLEYKLYEYMVALRKKKALTLLWLTRMVKTLS